MMSERFRFKRPALILGVLALLLAMAPLLWNPGTDGASQSAHYWLARIERGDLTSQVEATGTLEPVGLVEVGSQISGQVAQVAVDYNDPVRQGQVLARLDASKLEAQIQEAQALLERARGEKAAALAEWHRSQAEAENAAAQLRRLEALRKRGLGSESVVDQARTELRIARAKVDGSAARVRIAEAEIQRRQAMLRQRQIDLQRSVIRAPVDGIVIERNVEPGQTVAASLQAPTLFTLAGDLRAMRVIAAVDEADIGKVKEGQTAWFTVDAFPNRRFSGIVTQIRKAPHNQQNVVTYEVIIDAPNPDRRLLPGMTASVHLITAQRHDVLKVPMAALRFRPEDSDEDETRPRIWVKAGGKLRAVPVNLGISDGRWIEVSAPDLKPGQTVVIGYLESDSE
ncbi:MAG TPA: efflux RND transporter periplasmic adaptor subunit [Methylothermaceae bacterium]|nr:efflux RND transporter periplasmic adaptor subunit [Methylothermaceae bacterium]